jgi:Phage tail tube protein
MVASNIADVRFGIQAAKGTPLAASTQGLYLAGGTPPRPMRTEEAFAETTSLRMRSDRYVSEVHSEGAPQFYVMPKSIGALIYAALGGKSVTGAGDPWTHTIIPAASTPWLTFWRMIGNLLYGRFSDCKVKTLVIHGESGKPLTVTATIIGMTPVHKTAAETTAPIEVTQRFMHYDGAGALMVEGAAVASIRNFDITIENNSATVPGDSLTPNDVSEGELVVTVRATQLFTAASLYNRLFYGSASPADNAAAINAVLELAGAPAGLQFTFTRVAAAPGPERSLQIAVPRVQAQPFEVTPSTGNEPLTADITYMALQPAAGAAITAILKSGAATIT